MRPLGVPVPVLLLLWLCESRLENGNPVTGGSWNSSRPRIGREEKVGPLVPRAQGREEPGGSSNTSSPDTEEETGSGLEETTCAYKVLLNGRGAGRICFRTTDSGFSCGAGSCRVYRSGRSLVANVMANSSVFLQWQPRTLRHLRGFHLNCSWSGLYTKFQCDSVQLGVGCRDYLVSNVHDSVDYRICLHTVYGNRSQRDEDCLQFRAEPAGMQDIVIAMTAVGGSICVMLVIICLLVAYITENIMHPAFPRSSSKRGHDDHRVTT
ncbi:fibronectin type III domain-containing protein 10 [Heptranchias perlo]|uniref:fibronectin type III domain-containing protein 10 n=1 Tax=Heptranchias perlo TaxID=212740 RepID=UPI00355A20AE